MSPTSDDAEARNQDPDAPTKGVRGALELIAIGAFGCLSFVIVGGWLFAGWVAILASRLDGAKMWLAILLWFGVFVGLLVLAIRIAFRWLDARAYSGR